jgi:hypothetical protein
MKILDTILDVLTNMGDELVNTFAKLLSVYTFSEKERSVGNVNGWQGKQTSHSRTDELKAAVFGLYPLEP